MRHLRRAGRDPMTWPMVFALGAAALAGCSSDQDATTATTPPAASSTSADTAATTIDAIATTTTIITTTTTTTSSTTAPPIETSTAPTTATVPAETIATVPEQGVAGIDSPDPFCRGWGEFAGSFQALALVAGVGPDPVAAARLEVVASPAVVAAAQTLAERFPESIASERDTFVDDVIGPFARRAVRAAEELVAAGLSAVELEQLGDTWLVALTAAGVDDPEIVVDVPAGLDDEVDAATAVFSARVPAIAADPSLVTRAEAPMTFDYIASNCPDQGILGGNDAID